MEDETLILLCSLKKHSFPHSRLVSMIGLFTKLAVTSTSLQYAFVGGILKYYYYYYFAQKQHMLHLGH